MKFVIKMVIIFLGFLMHPIATAVSLFDETAYRPLIADKKAYLLGDLLTVIVMETSNAQSSADLASNKDIKTALEATYNDKRQDLSLHLSGKGQSAAKTGRNGKIKAALSVRIKAIQPEGSYRVEGHQRIRINGEEQQIFLKGIVRPEDISPQNTILSTRLAEAQITYTGKGSVTRSQSHHYIYQLLSFIGLI